MGGAGAAVVLAVAAARSGPSDTVWIALISALAAVMAAWIARDVKKQGKAHAAQLDVITDQVKNSHGTNLRDDLDALTELVREGFRAQQASIGGLHEDVRILHDRDGFQAREVAELRREIQRHASACSAVDRDQLG